jgi:2-amino-4-hydroxy-6-hydroxymethyldihydropteridine diphosphokinase
VSEPRTVRLALGSNQGDRRQNVQAAIAYLLRHGELAAVSSLYLTAPSGVLDQPPFYNAACALRTTLPLPQLLAAVKRIEWELGRRPNEVWGPRPIDIDILLAGDERSETLQLTVPHPRLAERAFVLVPLAEIASDAVHPVLRASVAALLVALPVEERAAVERIGGPGDLTPRLPFPRREGDDPSAS